LNAGSLKNGGPSIELNPDADGNFSFHVGSLKYGGASFYSANPDADGNFSFHVG
jgi:hypothetical protein